MQNILTFQLLKGVKAAGLGKIILIYSTMVEATVNQFEPTITTAWLSYCKTNSSTEKRKAAGFCCLKSSRAGPVNIN